jgi:hypothetical protein
MQCKERLIDCFDGNTSLAQQLLKQQNCPAGKKLCPSLGCIDSTVLSLFIQAILSLSNQFSIHYYSCPGFEKWTWFDGIYSSHDYHHQFVNFRPQPSAASVCQPVNPTLSHVSDPTNFLDHDLLIELRLTYRRQPMAAGWLRANGRAMPTRKAVPLSTGDEN